MIKVFLAILLLVGFVRTASVEGQVSNELEDACFADIELTNYVVEVSNGGSPNSHGLFTPQEVSQINTLITDENNAGLSVSKKVNAVVTACADGRILQSRNSKIINAR